MDVKLYAEMEGQAKQELDPKIILLTPLSRGYGIKQVNVGGQKVLAREELPDRQYEYHLQEPHGGKTLQKLMNEGKRFTLWVAYGETENVGRRKVFKPVETYVIKNLLPHTDVLSDSHQISLFAVTLDRPEIKD